MATPCKDIAELLLQYLIRIPFSNRYRSGPREFFFKIIYGNPPFSLSLVVVAAIIRWKVLHDLVHKGDLVSPRISLVVYLGTPVISVPMS